MKWVKYKIVNTNSDKLVQNDGVSEEVTLKMNSATQKTLFSIYEYLKYLPNF